MKKALAAASIMLASVGAMNAQTATAVNASTITATATEAPITKLRPGLRVYIELGDFTAHFQAAIMRVKVPIILTTNRDKADVEIIGTDDLGKGAGGFVFGHFGGGHVDNTHDVSAVVVNHVGDVIWAHSASYRGLQILGSNSEYVAMQLAFRLKRDVEKGGK